MYCKRCGAEFTGRECPACGQLHGDDSSDRGGATSSIFLESDERLIYQMNRGYVSNVVLGQSLSSDFVVLSDRRIYYSGSAIGHAGRSVQKMTGQMILPLEQVTSVSFVERKNAAVLAFAWLLLVLGLAFGALFVGETEGASFLAAAPSVLFFIIYFLTLTRTLVVSSPSASLHISYRLYGEKTIREFAHHLGRTLTRLQTAEVPQ